MTDSPSKPLAGGRISYLMGTVRDFPASVVFYRDLGFEEVYADDECAFLQLPGDAGPQLAFYPGRSAESPPSPNWMIIVDVPDIEAAVATLSGSGVAVGDIEDVPYGRAATFTDPDGNVVEVHQRSSS